MQKDHFVKVAIHLSIYAAQGDSNWPLIFKSLAKLLALNGCEEKDIKKNVLLFTFFYPTSAFTSVVECLHKVKNKYLTRDYKKPLPFKIIFHIDDHEGNELPLNDTTNDLWDFLEFGHLYVSKYLKEYLDQNALWKELPEHTVKSTESLKLFDVVFSKPSTITNTPLFPNRNLSIQGGGTTCFYCGMTQHKPTECPSKLLTMQTQGLLNIGNITFKQFNTAYGKTFSHFSKLANNISPQIDSDTIKNNIPLMALLAFFDISRVFQLRFFHSMFIEAGHTWPKLGEKVKQPAKTTALLLGFDNLQAGNYQEAQDKFESEAAKALGNLFYAHIGLAFVALEQGKDMANYLGSAIALARSTEAKIYGYLLLSRHYETTGENQKAETMMNFIQKLNFVCADTDYRNFQISAQKNITLKHAGNLKNLLAKQEFFMAALIDPALLPVRGIVESLLLYIFQKNILSAKRYYFLACKAYSELMHMVDEKEEIHDKIQKTLNNLEELLKEKQYSKIAGAAKRAKNASILCANLTEKINNEIKQKTEKTEKRLAELSRFWQDYQFKSYFKKFNEELIQQKNRYDAICAALNKGDKNNSFKEDKVQLYEFDKVLQNLEAKKQKMSDLKKSIDYFSTFGKYLLFTEGLMAFGGTTLLFLIIAVTEKNPWGNLLGSLRTLPYGQEIMIFLLAVAAPLLALILTAKNFLIKKMRN